MIKQMPLQQVTIQPVSWQEAEAYLRHVRTIVFIEEQLVSPAFEWDEIDCQAVHLLAMHDNQAIGCLRIIQYEKIGRMAVLKPWRGMGIGNQLLKKAIQICRLQGSQRVILSAQTHAVPFYLKAGFEIISSEYTDVHIPHVDMQLTIK